ncbi:MAG: bifunctional folylpolyglutamate synthase/dihydrofolate synthase [Acidobacteria bacterium]|nr:bifunctional folylpolyglutamate synthase/dihydrofolate synthase [Acidobacteriota bacterium]
MNYDQALQYLEDIQHLGIKFGLDNVGTVLRTLKDPHLAYPSVIVAGSNGKGSVCAMLGRILVLHEFNVGVYTSPHLISPRERIQINDEPISKWDFARLLTKLKKNIDRLLAAGVLPSPPTYFETMTCLAFLYFRRKKIDLAVLEVGMGGRFDATNISRPIVSVITTISLEHQEWLGDTTAQIAAEKAGVIKPDVPVVCGVEDPDAFDVILEKSIEVGASFLPVYRDKSWSFDLRDDTYTFEYIGELRVYRYTPSLPGFHQGKNAAATICAAEILSRNWKTLSYDKIIKGIESTQWPGRLERIAEEPPIILDGAHNEEGALALKEYIEEFLPGPITLVFASMRDKSIEAIASLLFPAADRIILTTFPFQKCAAPAELLERIPAEFHSRITSEPDPSQAIPLALKWGQASFSQKSFSTPNPDKKSDASLPGAVVFAGSLFLIGEAKKYFRDNPFR